MNDSRALYDWFAASVEYHGSLPALEIEERQWTYAALAARARAIAAALVHAHAGRAPARVGLLAARTPDAYAGYLAIQQLGAAAVPLNPGFPHARLATICARAARLRADRSRRIRGSWRAARQDTRRRGA
ncbi:AMP-binding protein [Burkholderia pseudomallei]|uniref:AMP-binding protein n=1 Tax=Burkholderia pseudomallei TaxID=28450 RepID=UPI000B10D73F